MRGPTRLGVIMYGAAAGTIDLGDDPPLMIGRKEEKPKAPLQRGVSWRWMTGTVLTGVTSIALMGAALMAALNNPNQFVDLPDSLARIAAGTSDIVFGQKGDRLRPEHEEVANRQIIQVSTVTRQGERDFIKLKPFAKITATLSLKPDQEVESKIPAYDPMRLFADTSAPEPAVPGEAGLADQLYGANVDGEVSVQVVAFPLHPTDLEPAATFQTAQAEQVIRAAAHPIEEIPDPTVLAYGEADYGSGDSLDSDFGVRITAENVSNIAKSDESAGSGDGFDEQMVAVGKKGGDLSTILKDAGIGDGDAGQIVGALSQLIDVAHLHSGQQVRLALTVEPGEEDQRPMRVSVYEDGVHQATVARADNNNFVRGDEPATPLESLYADADAEQSGPQTGGPEKLYDAVYQTALEQDIPQPLIDQLIRIFAFDVDFTGRANPGDAIEVLHSMPDPGDRDAGEPEILYAALNLGGAPKRFYRFRTPDDGIVDYYDDEGKSAKKFLIRKPMPQGRLTSGFGYRRHPILGRTILHAGVDYAAPRGTPILAAGNGIVVKAGRSSGYGNLTVIKHTNGYETAYGHQRGFAKGIKPGVRVHQGQVIGYVGSTGLSTGPHLHFEIRVNRKPVDPLRIRLPRGRVLKGEFLQAFERERTRIDTLLGNQAQPQKVAAAQ